jgi:hypothetical protein
MGFDEEVEAAIKDWKEKLGTKGHVIASMLTLGTGGGTL